ncbi:MAG: NAD-binding protein [Myxococcales bacterium]|nr:NAD-binding protein [Myxococcales bacterium]
MTSHDQVSTGDKIRYQIDRFMSWSPMARFIGLFGISFLLILLCAGLAVAVRPREPEKSFDFLEAMWWAMTRVADAGTMGDDEGTLVRLVATLSTLSGVMVVALLIGLVSSTIGDKIDDLRKGKSPVIDRGHTLILGYSEKVFTILRELREANHNQKHASAVILSEAEKEEVENEVRERMGDMLTIRVVVRQGSPFSPHDLKKVGAGRAKSIIVLASDADPTDDHVPGQADMGAIKAVLALRRIKGALTQNHVVVELLDGKRRAVVERLGAGGIEVVAMKETLSRMIVQTARQNGLAQVYRDLLTYEGSEFYFKSFPELAGQPFGVTQFRMKDAVVAGVRRVEPEPQCILNPPEDFLLQASDQLLVLAEDDDTFSLTASHQPSIPPGFEGSPPRPRTPEKVLVCGMGDKISDMLREFDNYVLAGSEAWLMPGWPKEEFAEFIRAEVQGLKNLKLKYVEGDPTMPDALKKVASPDFSVALIMADDRVSEDEADARTVITVLLLRELFQAFGPHKPRIISEILDPRTKDLLEQDYGADFVVSSEITSMLLAQVSERRELNAVFADLFDSDGNEVYLKRAACYAPIGQHLSWISVQKVARTRGEVAIGYIRAGQPPLINPKQDEMLAFSEEDRVIVISEDDSEEPKGAAAEPVKAAAGQGVAPARAAPSQPTRAPQPSAPPGEAKTGKALSSTGRR